MSNMFWMFGDQHKHVKLMMNHVLNSNNAMVTSGLSWFIMVQLPLHVTQICLLTDNENKEVKFLKFCVYKM
jgi:hypothetical protein